MARLALSFALAVRASAACTSSGTTFCMRLNVEAAEAGLYEFEGISGVSPDLVVQIGKTYTFDQSHASNWYRPVGFAYRPDGAHGATWGGDEREEIGGAGELQYKIDGSATTCPEAGDTGLDCYEPEFVYPRAHWMAKRYTAELTITQAMADASHGGVIYYFCRIHSKMSGKIIIQNADGSPVTTATGGPLPNPKERELYPVPERGAFDISCGSTGAEAYARSASMACKDSYLRGSLDTDFKKCMRAIDCQMNRQMRVAGHDTHQSAIVTFMQQIIPHHINAVNMAKILLKFAPTEVLAVKDLEDILWSIINEQNYQVHQFRNYLGGSSAHETRVHNGSSLVATSVGEHCDSSLDVDVSIEANDATPTATAAVTDCVASDNHLCMKVNLHSGESGYYEFAGYTGPSPDIVVRIGQTYTFDQRDPSNWYHPVGFAYYPDGAHGATWGGDEREEVEAAGELLYKIDGSVTTCPDARDTGLDCYKPEFFYPRADWMAKNYAAELTITQAMADKSHGGVIYYFCHIHSKMSGRIIIQNADGSPVTTATSGPLPNPEELELYTPTTVGGVDSVCGTTGVADYAGGASEQCDERFLCGPLDTDFEKCMQAIYCKMKTEVKSYTSAYTLDKAALFMQQMIPHHENAVNMAKVLSKQVPADQIDAAMEDGALTEILNNIINVQSYQIHQFRDYLGGLGLLPTPKGEEEKNGPTPKGEEQQLEKMDTTTQKVYGWPISAKVHILCLLIFVLGATLIGLVIIEHEHYVPELFRPRPTGSEPR